MKRTFNLLVLVTLLALTFGAQGVSPAQAATPAVSPAYIRSTVGAPWDVSTNEAAMDDVFGSGNWDDLRYETVVPATLFSSAYDFIFMEGGDYNADEMEAFIAANQAAMEDWVAGGGKLLLNSAPNEGDGMSFGFGGVLLIYWDVSTTADAVDSGHPIFNGPFTPAGTSYTGDGFSHASVATNDDTPLILGGDGQTILSEMTWGDGCVMFGGMTTDNFHAPQPNAANLRRNILDYLSNCSNQTTRLFGTTGQGGGSSTLVELDPDTGALIATIGSVGYAVNGLDYDPASGTLYATTSVNDANFPSGLLTIDMTTGAGTPVASLGSPEGCLPTNIRANAGGTLFAWSECEDDLIVINPATGGTFRVGESGLGTAVYGMSFDASNVLYFVNPGGIFTINKYTGAASYVTSFPDFAHHGDFHPDTGRFWGIDTNGSGTKNINVVNVGSGAIDATLPTVNNLHTLTFVPGNQPAVDVTAPVLSVPANIVTQQNVPGGAVVTFSPSATDETSPANPDARCIPASGSVFPVGTTTVKCYALDDQGNADFGNFDVTVNAAPGGNLLKKPTFDNATAFPTPWQGFGVRPPYIKALDCSYFNFAPCSVVFPAGNRSAMQRVVRSGMAGDTYSFGMYSAANNVPGGGKYLVEVGFYNNYNRLINLTQVEFNLGTHGFELASGPATAAGNYNRIVFRFYYQNPTGRAWFDDAFLYFMAP